MNTFSATHDETLRAAVLAVERGGDALLDALDALPAPIYVTDAEGVITHYNAACIGFTGRTPTVGKDRWCVTWRLYTDLGEALPHDQCPMAEAIHSRQPVRGVVAVAERPDGTRVSFLPFPTPILDADGTLKGAVNMLIDVTDTRQIAELRSQAERCKRLACGVNNQTTADMLHELAAEYDAKAAGLEAAQVN